MTGNDDQNSVRANSGGPIDWLSSSRPVAYETAVAEMEARVARIVAGEAHEAVWLLEHPPLYTAGTSAREHDLLSPSRFPVHRSGRGGQFTYHGPGQRIAYVMLDVRRRFGDVRAFVQALEAWVIATLHEYGVDACVRDGRVGVWVPRANDALGRDDKIAAIGIRLRRWVSFHGVAINVSPDLSHFEGIVPCGISEHGVTSLAALGHSPRLSDVDDALKRSFARTLGGRNTAA